MNIIRIIFRSLLTILLTSSLSLAFDGPLQIRNQFPLFLPVNAPYLDNASLKDYCAVNFSYSSLYLVRKSTSWSVGLDLEIAELDLRLRKNIRDFIEVGIEIPVISFNAGFMDNFLNSYHDTLGFPDYGRSSRPDNNFSYDVKKDGVSIIKGKSGGIGIGDIRLTLKTPLLRGDPAVSIKADIELPTGNAKKGFGNGSIDMGGTVLIEKQWGEYFKSYLNIGAVFPGKLKGHEKINLRVYPYSGAALEANILKNISLIGQLFVQGSPFPKTDIPSVDRTAALLTLGGRYHAGSSIFDISFTEDPNTSGAPDFSANLSFKKMF